jgi:outer membrane protein assembly factor BamB
MDALTTDYRRKWRIRRQQMRLRRIPVVAVAAGIVAIALMLSLSRHRAEMGAVAWARGDGTRGRPRIALGAGILVAVWETGTVTAHFPTTGDPVWPEPFGRAHQFMGPPAVGKDCIVFGAADCYVKCLELSNGDPRWGYDTEALVRSTPLIVGDRVYIGADDGRLYAFRLDSDIPEWVFPPVDRAATRPILGGAAAVGDTIVCGSCDRSVFALDIGTGKLRWRRKLDSPVIARVTAAGKNVCVAAESGRVECLRATDGQPVWSLQASGLVRRPVLIQGMQAFVSASDRTLLCVTADGGEMVWQRKLDGRPTTSAIADAERVYVGTSDDAVQALSRASGQTVWRWRPGSKPIGDLLLGAGHLYCTTSNGRIFAVRLPAAPA